MNKAASLLLFASASLTSCITIEELEVDTSGSGSSYHRSGGYGEDYRSRQGWTTSRAYAEGCEQGELDRQLGSRKDPYRHRGEVPSSLFSHYANGYNSGYGSDDDRLGYNRPPMEGPETYRNGYRRGHDDGESHASFNPGRHKGHYPKRYEDSFFEGYEKGYKDAKSHWKRR